MKKNGQSIVEYVLIAILVILGIVFMGPYVLRSVNAHFKLWDEGVQDSFGEHLKQAPPSDVPPMNITCQCTQVTEPSCGGLGLLCAANQREVDYNCNPQGCNGAAGRSYCVTQPDCCTAPAPVGCGTFALPTNASGTVDLSLETTSQNPPQPPAVGNCYYGQQIIDTLCGSSTSVQCTPSATCPMPSCQGFMLFQNSTSYCPGAQNNLTQNTANNYVGNSPANCNSANGPCQVYCNPPYTVNSATHPTGCVLQFTVAPLCDQSNFRTIGSSCVCIAGCGSESPTYKNTEDFSMCVDPSTVITSLSLVPYGPTVNATPGIPENNGGCGDPGEPSQTCAISVSF